MFKWTILSKVIGHKLPSTYRLKVTYVIFSNSWNITCTLAVSVSLPHLSNQQWQGTVCRAGPVQQAVLHHCCIKCLLAAHCQAVGCQWRAKFLDFQRIDSKSYQPADSARKQNCACALHGSWWDLWRVAYTPPVVVAPSSGGSAPSNEFKSRESTNLSATAARQLLGK